MGPQYQRLELISFHSVSKGFYGEYDTHSLFTFWCAYIVYIIGVEREEDTWS